MDQTTGVRGTYGTGLLQSHWNAGVTMCADCHDAAEPAKFTPVGEDVSPPYYFTPDPAHPTKPTNPCNPSGEEDYGGSASGLDNDGDGLYDDDALQELVSEDLCGDEPADPALGEAIEKRVSKARKLLVKR